MATFKTNAADFRAALRRHGRDTVYHWTPAHRLSSVLTQGILCRRELDTRGIQYDPHGYGRPGKERDFSGHVCVSFYPQRGMMRTETGAPAVIAMTSEVIILEGTFYCPENTAKAEYEFGEIAQKTSVADLDHLFQGPNEWKLRDWQAEVWIPNSIPVPAFTSVYFRTTEDRDAAAAACAHLAPSLPKTITFSLPPHWLRF